MTVSHIGVTVSHLPTSCSFYLAALQPLGYRFVGQQGSQIGLGINDADFFLCQETSSVKAGSAHIAFTAPSRTSVRDFYTAALNSGARPNGAPASRTEEDGHFNAAILDPDGNSVEVVFKNGPDLRDDGTVIKHSRVITWQRTVTDSYQDDRTVRSSHTLSKAPPGPSLMTVASKAASMARSVSEPTGVPQAGHAQAQAAPNKGDSGAKTIIGTLIGAAAGAAVVYAMVKSEQDSAQKESDFNALKQAKNMVSQFAPQFLGTNQQPQQMDPQPQPVYEISPKPLHRSLSDTGSEYSAASAQRTVRAIEPAPSNYHSETYTLAPSRSEAPRSEYREPPRSEYSEYTEVSRREPPRSEYREPPRSEYSEYSEVSRREPQRSEPPRSEYREPPRSEYSEYTEVSRREPQRSEAPRSEYREARSEAPRSEYREARSEYSEASRSDASRDYAPSRNQKAVEYRAPSNAPSNAPSTASARSRAIDQGVEYLPAASVAPSVSEASSYRSRSSSEYKRPKAIEYLPAASVAGPRSQFSSHRSTTSPESSYGDRHSRDKYGDKARSSASRAHSAAPSTLISSFVADNHDDGSVASRSKHSSRRHSHSKQGSSRAPSPPRAKSPSIASKASSFVDNMLHRDRRSSKEDDQSDYEIDDFDNETVAPDDSISQIGGRRHRSHRSKHGSGSSADTSVSKNSSSSKHKSSKSHHSSSSRRSHRRDSSSPSSSAERHRLPTIVSEHSEATTVMPAAKTSSRPPPSSVSTTINRKDSITQPSEYEGNVTYGNGVVEAAAGKEIPIRGITQSMVDGVEEEHRKQGNKRSMMSYALGQKIRAFEGN